MDADPVAPASQGTRLSPARGCALAVLLALIPALFVLAAGVLAIQGEIAIHRGSLTETRLWLVREPGNAGLGFSSGRMVQGGLGETAACVATRVRFVLWRSDGSLQHADFCECFERDGEAWQLARACP